MPDAANIETRLAALFSTKLNVAVPSLETDVIETGLVDSLTFVEFLAQLELEFGVRVSLEDLNLDHFRTITRIAAFVAAKSCNDTTVSLRE